MIKRSYRIPLQPEQELYLIPLGDVHYGSDECDVERLERLVQWAVRRKKKGALVRFLGLGDYFEKGSRTEKRAMQDVHEGIKHSMDALMYGECQALLTLLAPLKGDFLGLLGGHHAHEFIGNKHSHGNGGKTVDQVLAAGLKSEVLGNPLSGALVRLQFPHALHLDIFAHHGGGGAQTPGGRVQKRMRIAEIAPTAHIVISGHDNAKFAYPRSGLDFEHGSIKRYVIGSGSFQRAYMETEGPSFAESLALIPADLGVSIVKIEIEERHGKWRVDYHASV